MLNSRQDSISCCYIKQIHQGYGCHEHTNTPLFSSTSNFYVTSKTAAVTTSASSLLSPERHSSSSLECSSYSLESSDLALAKIK